MCSTTCGGVGLRSRLGRELRSCRPAGPSCSRRVLHFRPVRGQTPAASLAACGVCPTKDHSGQPLSTVRRQPSILMDVHSAPLQGSSTPRQHQVPRPGLDGQPLESSHPAKPGQQHLASSSLLTHRHHVHAATLDEAASHDWSASLGTLEPPCRVNSAPLSRSDFTGEAAPAAIVFTTSSTSWRQLDCVDCIDLDGAETAPRHLSRPG